MERIIKAVEEKLKAQEDTIFIQKYEIEDLKRKLAEAEETIESQAHIINDLKGANA